MSIHEEARRGGGKDLPRDQVPAAEDAGDPIEELASSAARGNRVAFEAIYLLQVDDIYRYARAHARSNADAEDIVATVFLKAWQHARQYRVGSDSYRRWLFGIARNEVRNHWRKHRVAQLLTLELERAVSIPDGVAGAPGVDPDRLAAAFARLTTDQRDVLTLRYFAEKTPRQIGDLLGKQEGSIRALQFRALRQLRKAVTSATT